MRPIPLLTSLMLAALLVLPSAVAEETTYAYTAAPSAWVLGKGLGIYPCPNGCDVDGDGQNDYPFDHGPFLIATAYSDVIITAQDAVWEGNVGMFACSYNTDGDGLCDQDGNGPACGAIPIFDSPFGGDLLLHLVAVLVEEDLTTCGATTGTITVTSS